MKTSNLICKSFNIYIFLSISCYQISYGDDILAVFPFPGKSHQAVFNNVVLGLCKKGHNVTLFSPFPVSLPDNCKQILLPDYIVEMMKAGGLDESYASRLGSQSSNFYWSSTIRQLGLGVTKLTLKDPIFQDLISSNQHFDLILLETTFMQESLIALHHRFKAPVVEIFPPSNCHWTYYLHGNPYDTNYIVDMFNPYSDSMTFQERLINTFSSIAIRANYLYYYMPKYQALMDKYFRYPGWESRPSLLDMVKNTSLLMMNSHLALNYPYPLSPNVVEIGGIHLQNERKPLPKDIQDFMDDAENGVIYFTLGSHIQVSSTLGDNMKKEFEKAFSKLPQRVLWKWEKDYPNPPPNVKISKWFPQQDILGHKNMKLFITHGGLLSVTEAIANGLPLVGIPMLGDQPKNVKHISHYGYGIGLDFSNLTEQSISWAIEEILVNPRYKKNAEIMCARFKDQPHSALDTAIYWIEYVMRHKGASHLKPAITTMPWYQQALLDVYLALAFICTLLLLPLYFIIVCIKYSIMFIKAKYISKQSSKKGKIE